MLYIHSFEIFQHDFKYANIFLDENLHLKFGDFVLTKEINVASPLDTVKHVETSRWRMFCI